MHLAICDDQKELLPMLAQLISQLEAVETITTFSKPEDMLERLDEQIFDVVLMDIDLGQEKTGIDYAQELYQKSPETHVIYLTGYSDQFIHKIFFQESNLCGYLSKPLRLSELEILLKKVQQKQQQQKSSLLIQYKKVIQQIWTKDIIYLESKAHLIHIVTPQETYVCREKLDEIKARLPEEFLQVHKSFIVNIHQIKEINRKFVILQSDVSVPVSRTRYEQIREEFFHYKARHMEETYARCSM